MIELNSVVVVLMMEVIAALLVCLLLYFFFSKKKNNSEQKTIHALVDKVNETRNIKNQQLEELISSSSIVDPLEKKEMLGEISRSEQLLYQRIVEMFLKRDETILGELDQHIDSLSAPYCKLLSYSFANDDKASKIDVDEQKFKNLQKENENLSIQLGMAMKTIDEISTEYAQIFNGSQTELELKNSSKKMFKVFRTAEQHIRSVSETFEIERE